MTHILSGMRLFAHRHDELPAFHAAYLVLTLLVAALFNIGLFGLLIVAHMALDVVKYREYHQFGPWKTLRATVRESLVDEALFALGLLIALYLHHSLPAIAGISGLLRAEITIAEGLGTLIPKAEILHRFLHVICDIRHHILHTEVSVGERLRPTERFAVLLLGASGILFLLAPVILGIDRLAIVRILQEQLIPWHF